MTNEASLALPAPAVSSAEAARLASDLFGLRLNAEGSVTPLPGEYDANFKVTSDDDRSFVLKVMHPGRERGLIEMQCAALEHLARTSPALLLPRVQPTLAGEFIAVLPRSAAGGVPQAEPPRFVWMLSYVEGTPLAEVRPPTDAMLLNLGRFLGQLDAGLSTFTHDAAARDFKWNLAQAGWIAGSLEHLKTAGHRALVERALRIFESRLVPIASELRQSIIHADANDYNVLIADDATTQAGSIASVIDFGDMHRGFTVGEVAIAAAYALLGRKDPLAAAAMVVRGYHSAFPLDEREIEAIFPLILTRLAVSVTNSAIRHTLKPDDPYVTISEAPAWGALEALQHVTPELAAAMFRRACGLDGSPRSEKVAAWIADNANRMAPVLDHDLRVEPCVVFDLSVGSPLLGADPRATETATLTETLFKQMREAGVPVGVGRYDEARLLYVSPLFGQGEGPLDERRTIHLGVDLFIEPGAPVRAPLAGVVHILTNNAAPQDYGPLVVLRHETDAKDVFFTLYGHLSEDTLQGVALGQRVEAGQEIARVGEPPTNGDWSPHLHFQIIVDLLGLDRDFPGVCRASERTFWKEMSPDPNLILGIPADRFGEPRVSADETLAKRRALIGSSVRTSYRHPLKAVRGFGAYLYDETGRAFLDMYNNVPLVGHSHPRVVRAVQRQIGLLNTNTRYLHDDIVRYADRLTSLMPDPLRVCFFVNSGSEANELALRLARAHTGRQDVIVLENAYHGHTSSLIDVSPYKFNGPGGAGRKDFVRVAVMPDDYRGPYRRDDPQAGRNYGRDVGLIVEEAVKLGRPPAAFIAETLPSVGGQIVPPSGYLAEVYRHVRAAGGVCVADEVQVGFGRLGSYFWGFEMQGVIPDIVVLGKPMGNGFPLGAVVTSAAIAKSFDNGMEFFSTFGGNPVACAAGLSVLDVLRDESLAENARTIGMFLLGSLRALQERHPLIGDVRGLGLFIGVELVRDRRTLEPATAQAAYVVNRLRDLGVLTGTDGPHENVLKLRPPLVLTREQAEMFVTILDLVLAEDRAKP